MNRSKIIYVCLGFLIVLSVIFYFKIKHRQEIEQKTILAHEIRKGVEHLMLDLAQARESSIRGVPIDGAWHDRIFFESRGQGVLEYLIHDGHLLRVHRGRAVLIADHIDNFHIRRQSTTPDILEVEIKAQANVSLVSNLKIRVFQ